MYITYGNYQVNKTRAEYLAILSHFFPKDRDKFKEYPHRQLRAIFINTINRRNHGKKGEEVEGVENGA